MFHSYVFPCVLLLLLGQIWVFHCLVWSLKLDLLRVWKTRLDLLSFESHFLFKVVSSVEVAGLSLDVLTCYIIHAGSGILQE